MSEKCPYCYSLLGIHTHDPIILPDGNPYKWLNDTTLIFEPDIEQRFYKGNQQVTIDEVKEIQDILKDLEEENLDPEDRTIFSPLNSSGFFQITGQHIKEMRNSVEKLLDAFGFTKIDYFNYDEDENHIIHPDGDKLDWIDPITESTDLQKFQVKYIHIEDLRHPIVERMWVENWTSPIIINGSKSWSLPNFGTITIPNDFTVQADHYWTGDPIPPISFLACADHTTVRGNTFGNINLSAGINKLISSVTGEASWVSGLFGSVGAFGSAHSLYVNPFDSQYSIITPESEVFITPGYDEMLIVGTTTGQVCDFGVSSHFPRYMWNKEIAYVRIHCELDESNWMVKALNGRPYDSVAFSCEYGSVRIKKLRKKI
jgi:hypothetical protein